MIIPARGRMFVFALVVFMAAYGLPACGEDEAGNDVERYRYEAMPEGSFDHQLREVIDTRFVTAVDSIEYTATVTAMDRADHVRVVTDKRGRFVFAMRDSRSGSDEEVRRVWRDDSKVYVGNSAGKSGKAKSLTIPNEYPLAVDASLLILLRSFPFDTETEWNVFMVDFSGASITVSVHQAGVEGVFTPEGIFDCYKMEVVVNVPLLRPKITYWLAKKSPHFLVKQRGKRGPFTASYITSLVSMR